MAESNRVPSDPWLSNPNRKSVFAQGFVGAFAVLAVAVVISAGCMIMLAREGL